MHAFYSFDFNILNIVSKEKLKKLLNEILFCADVRQFWVVLGSKILGMGCTFTEKFWDSESNFARNSGNAQVLDN